MNAESLFNLANGIAAVGWLALVVLSPFWKNADKFVMGVIVVLLSCVYTWANFSHLGEVGGLTAFFSYEGVIKVFQNPYLVAAAWAHILAVDLLAAVWIRKNAATYDIPYWAVVPILLLTCVLGPLGIIVYMLVRWAKTKDYFAAYFC